MVKARSAASPVAAGKNRPMTVRERQDLEGLRDPDCLGYVYGINASQSHSANVHITLRDPGRLGYVYGICKHLLNRPAGNKICPVGLFVRPVYLNMYTTPQATLNMYTTPQAT